MTRALIAIVLEAVFFALAFGWRSLVQWRRTGSTGLIRPRRGAPFAELAGSVGFVVALVLLVAAPLADLCGVARIGFLDSVWVAGTGVLLSIAALVMLFAALEMQVRLVEEPYLTRAHAHTYAEYRATTGRFVPRSRVGTPS